MRPFLFALVVSIALAGCGSSGNSAISPSAYVKSVCSSVGPFEKDVVNRSSTLDLATITDAAQGKAALQGFLQAVSEDTDRALAQLKSAGAPNVKNGKEIAGAIVSAFTDLKSTMVQAVNQAGALPTDSAAAFKADAQALGTTVRASMTRIGTNLQSSTLRSAEVEKAAADEPACKSMGNG